MANAQLIQVAKELGASQGFNDVGAAFEKGFSKWYDTIETQFKERQEKKEQAEARVLEYMDKMPSTGMIAKIPQYAKEKVSTFLNNGRKEYAKHAKAIRDLDPEDKEYQDHINAMNSISDSFVNLDTQFERLLEQKVEFMQEVDGQTLSAGNDFRDIDFLSNVFTDSTDMAFSPEGNILFSREGKQLSLDELPTWIEVNNTIPTELVKLSSQYFKNGVEITGALENNLRHQVENLIKSSGRAGIVSLAADDSLKVGGHGLGITNDLLHDKSRHQELTEKVVNAWVESIKATALQGKQEQKAKEQAKINAYWSKQKPEKKPYSLDDIIIPKNPDKQE